MSEKIRWGVLGVANIAVKKVIPAMQKGRFSEITAIASRDAGRASQAAADLGIPKPYGSYQDLLADPTIQAVYNPLPNHLHVPLSIKAAEAGKHVLCEKPLSAQPRNGCARGNWCAVAPSANFAPLSASSVISTAIRKTSAIYPKLAGEL
jgi:predicted dehydrogenase